MINCLTILIRCFVQFTGLHLGVQVSSSHFVVTKRAPTANPKNPQTTTRKTRKEVSNRMSSKNRNSRIGKGMNRLAAGWASWRWLSGVSSKEKQWFIGTLRGRGGYESWMAHLTKGLQEPDFLLKFEGTSDAWERSRLVGERIRHLRESYRDMTQEERTELARQTEVELKTGLELLGRDKKTIQDLITLVDPPTTQ